MAKKRKIEVHIVDEMDEGFEEADRIDGEFALDYKLIRKKDDGTEEEQQPYSVHILSALEIMVSNVIEENLKDKEDQLRTVSLFCKHLLYSLECEDRIISFDMEDLEKGADYVAETLQRKVSQVAASKEKEDLMEGLSEEQKLRLSIHDTKLKH